MIVISTKQELRETLSLHRGKRIGFVPTMGFLHEGHLSLFRAARERDELVVASIFVNPTQFAAGEDLDVYPRDEAGDTEKARSCGVDVLWIPPAGSVYGAQHATKVVVEGLQEGLCGISRPHFFTGVATIVCKLFCLVKPDRAYFGEKDYQQLTIIRRMSLDLDLEVEVVGMPLVRDTDGIALASRNAYLGEDERAQAQRLSGMLRQVNDAFAGGVTDGAELLAMATAALHGMNIDYLSLVDAETLRDRGEDQAIAPESAVLATAVWVGKTRLLDNHMLGRPLSVG